MTPFSILIRTILARILNIRTTISSIRAASSIAESYKGIDIISPKVFAMSAGNGYAGSKTDVGTFGTFPTTISTAMVSPNALEKPRTIAANIPGLAFLRTTCFIVCHFVAPRDRETSLMSWETLLKTSPVTEIIIGKTIMERTIPPARIPYPPMVSTPRAGARVFLIKGTTASTPHKPYTTEGIPASRSISGFTAFLRRLPAYSERYIELSRLMGTAIIVASPVTHNVPMINGKNPNFPSDGPQSLEKRRSVIGTNDNMGLALI